MFCPSCHRNEESWCHVAKGVFRQDQALKSLKRKHISHINGFWAKHKNQGQTLRVTNCLISGNIPLLQVIEQCEHLRTGFEIVVAAIPGSDDRLGWASVCCAPFASRAIIGGRRRAASNLSPLALGSTRFDELHIRVTVFDYFAFHVLVGIWSLLWRRSEVDHVNLESINSGSNFEKSDNWHLPLALPSSCLSWLES